MISSTQWTRVWTNSGIWWRTGKPGVLWFMGSQRAGHDWATELNWTELVPNTYSWMISGQWSQVIHLSRTIHPAPAPFTEGSSSSRKPTRDIFMKYMKQPLRWRIRRTIHPTLTNEQDGWAVIPGLQWLDLHSTFRYLLKAQRKVHHKPQTTCSETCRESHSLWNHILWQSGHHYQCLPPLPWPSQTKAYKGYHNFPFKSTCEITAKFTATTHNLNIKKRQTEKHNAKKQWKQRKHSSDKTDF